MANPTVSDIASNVLNLLQTSSDPTLMSINAQLTDAETNIGLNYLKQNWIMVASVVIIILSIGFMIGKSSK